MIGMTIGGVAVIPAESSIQIQTAVEQRSTCNAVVIDTSGLSHFRKGQRIVITDTLTSITLFAGFIDNSTETSLFPNPGILSALQCVDKNALADKLQFTTTDFTSTYAGDAAIDVLNQYLIGEGVSANYAQRKDATQANFAAGTLSGLTAAANIGVGDLELSPAGTQVTKTEATTTDWNANLSSSNLDATGNQLQIASVATLQLTGTCGNNFGNAFAYQKIWGGNYTIAVGDTLKYSVWISSTSPQIMAGVDGVCTDATTIRDHGHLDQNGMNAHPNTELSGLANDQWYSRTIDMVGMNGKVLSYITVAFEGDNGGSYTAFFRDIKIMNGGTTKVTVYQGLGPHATITQPSTNKKISSNGYSHVILTPLLDRKSTRLNS